MESILKDIINILNKLVILEILNMTLELVDHVSKICCILWRLLPCRGDKGLPVDVVYLYFSKAFDKVLHNRLINNIKIHQIGCFVATLDLELDQ